MAFSKGNPMSSSRGVGSSLPRNSLTRSKGATTNPTMEEASARLIFEGHRWSSTIAHCELDTAGDSFNIPNLVALGLPDQHCGAIDVRGMIVSVVFNMTIFVMGLHLPFVRIVRDVLDVLGLLWPNLYLTPGRF